MFLPLVPAVWLLLGVAVELHRLHGPVKNLLVTLATIVSRFLSRQNIGLVCFHCSLFPGHRRPPRGAGSYAATG